MYYSADEKPPNRLGGSGKNEPFKGCSPLCVGCLALLFLISVAVLALRVIMKLDVMNPFGTTKYCANTGHTVSIQSGSPTIKVFKSPLPSEKLQ